MKDLRQMELDWLPRAKDHALTYGVDESVVLAAAQHPQQVTADPSSVARQALGGWPCERRRRGDVTAVVAYPPGRRPVIWGVYLHLPLDVRYQRSPGGAGEKLMPTSMREVRRRLVKFGLKITSGGKHDRVEDREGHYIGSLPRTPSDYRTIPNVVAMLARKGYDLTRVS